MKTDATKKILSTEIETLKESYIETIETLIKKQIENDPLIKVVAIGVPGAVFNNKITYITNYDELKNFDLSTYLKEKLEVDILVLHDMHALMFAVSEQLKFSEEKDLAVAILTKDGSRCRIMVNGKILSEFSDFAGEIGFLIAYNTSNLQTIAENSFENCDIADYTARLISCVCAVVNPKTFVLIDNGFLPDLSAVASICSKYLPSSALPTIEKGGVYDVLYDTGLAKIAFDTIYNI